MRARRWWAAAILCACGVSWYWLLPRAPVVLPTRAVPNGLVRGVVHVHTRRSDGTGTVDDVAAAAARAGLQFVIFTDHGDGTRQGEAPAYRSGVLCIDAVEVSTEGGHVLALGLPQMPYPLGGEARDVLADIHRMGAMGFAAHPSSDRHSLRWSEWGTALDGLEWLNADSEWRDEDWPTLARALLTYPFRRTATLAGLLDRPAETLQRWDDLTRRRQVVALAAVDAHARLSLTAGDPYRAGPAVHVPSYEQMFRAMSVTVSHVQLSGVGQEDARAVLEAIRRGHLYSTIDGLAGPAVFRFSAMSGGNRAEGGDRLAIAGSSVEVGVETNAPAGARIVLVKDGAEITSSSGPMLTYAAPATPGVYRAEVQLATAPGDPPVPWVVSNPIYVGMDVVATEPDAVPPQSVAVAPVYQDGPAVGWQVERSPRSLVELDVVPSVGGTQLSLRYGLGGTVSERPYVALVAPASPAPSDFDRLIFTIRALRPMRLSVQVRASGQAQDVRWRRSVYLDDTPRTIAVFLDDMTPVGQAAGRPVPSGIHDVLFVVDTVNAAPGSSGQIWIDDIKYAR